MRTVDKDGNDIDPQGLDEDCFVEVDIVRKGADPIDDVTKFAWADDDWERVLQYCPPSPEKVAEREACEAERKRKAAKAAEVPDRLSALEASTDDVLLLVADMIGGAL